MLRPPLAVVAAVGRARRRASALLSETNDRLAQLVVEVEVLREQTRQVDERLGVALRGARVVVWDIELRTSDAGAAHLVDQDGSRLPGSLAEAFGARLSVEVRSSDREKVSRAIAACLTGEAEELHVEYRAIASGERWHSARGVVVRDADGRPTRLTGSSSDITDRKYMEQQLRESEQRWRSLIETLPQFVWTATAEGIVDFFSAHASHYTGISAREMSFAGIVHPDDREQTTRTWAEVLRTQGTYQVEHRIRSRDGEYRWFATRAVAVRDDSGGPVKWFGTCTDITTAKQQEEELRHAKERLELAMRSSNLTIWEYDMPDGRFENSSETLTNVWESLGYDPLEKASESLSTVMHPEDVGRVNAAVRAYLVGEGGTFESEHRVRHRDGKYRWILARGVAVRDDGARPRRFVGTSVDITEMKRIEAELQEAREVAEAASRAKDEFLANVSHEIRTPMNAILGMTELAIDSARSDHQKQLLSTVKSAARNLLGVINDLLDFSKIAAGKLTLDQSPFSLRATLSDTLRALITRAQKKGLELTWYVQPDVRDALEGDAGRLRQVLMNLVGNAIKFTARGHVAVEVRNARLAARSDRVASVLSFSVRDTGIGIARDKQAAIFLAFEQADASTTRKYGGTGLGLTISARLVQLMGGQITVVSEPGQGSTFEFTVRFAHSTPPEEARYGLSPQPPEGARVLLVDSNERERGVLVEWLTDWRFRPVAVGDAMAAIEALVRAELAGAPFSLALIDESLPDVDGVVLASRIRERFGAGARLVVLGAPVAAHLTPGSRAVGALGHLARPLQKPELLSTLMEALAVPEDVLGQARLGTPTLGKDALRDPRRRAELSPVRPPLRILVAEDNELNVRLLSELLRSAGHDAYFAADGRSALEAAEHLSFDLMLLDLHMPELDGFSVTQAIRERERTTGKHLPIVAFTARSSNRERDRCLAAGMDDFLSKPIETTELWAAVERMVRVSPATRVGARLVDPSAVLRACGGDDAVLSALRRALQQGVPVQLASVRSALNDGDRLRLALAAHLLCGTLSAFSTAAAELARTVEESAAHQPLSSCTELVERLESVCAELLKEALTCHVAGLTAAASLA